MWCILPLPRAIGGWDFAALNSTEEAVWALDADEAGPYGAGGKPPSNEDGTPAETLADQVVRLTNLMSVLETLYSGDTVSVCFCSTLYDLENASFIVFADRECESAN